MDFAHHRQPGLAVAKEIKAIGVQALTIGVRGCAQFEMTAADDALVGTRVDFINFGPGCCA